MIRSPHPILYNVKSISTNCNAIVGLGLVYSSKIINCWAYISILLRCVVHVCFFYPADRLHDFVVGLTMTHPTNFPHHPDNTSVMPHLSVCHRYPGLADFVMPLNCTQPVWGRYLVITMPDIEGRLSLAEVIVDSTGRFTVPYNGAMGEIL